MGIGACTPPMARVLFQSTKIADVKLQSIVKPLMPLLILVALPIMLLVAFGLSGRLSGMVPGR